MLKCGHLDFDLLYELSDPFDDRIKPVIMKRKNAAVQTWNLNTQSRNEKKKFLPQGAI